MTSYIESVNGRVNLFVLRLPSATGHYTYVLTVWSVRIWTSGAPGSNSGYQYPLLL